MQESWRIFLQNHNAVINDDRVDHFGNIHSDFEQIQSSVLVDLSHHGLLAFSGEDAQSFLQNQLTCDVRQVNEHQAQYGSYCTPKGRVLANFVLWQNDTDWLMQLPLSLCSTMQKRLSMFILRSKVKINDYSNQRIHIGVAGNQASQCIAEYMQVEIADAAKLQIVQTPQTTILIHATNRIELITSLENAKVLWETLSQHAEPSGAVTWEWLGIQSGIPVITPPTQEEFLPQMINLDLIGGVSFKKGCYPGQEIVARTQYLGKLKRRMYRIHIATDEVVSPGDDFFDADIEDQSCGKIVNVAPSPIGGYDALAVIQNSSIEAGKIYWKKTQNFVVEIEKLPYMLD